ncbi:hypothetical protein C0Q70_20130 [Pomacea canaliculata]|uniref:Uncharacterized protein n=1 Tax=Pomacea canaliculata TaxID=400727 RepID=A0A2T7NEP9_POMCA|nr:hypothetical protein C0Q70_20130 [Pomacea canaliculata]
MMTVAPLAFVLRHKSWRVLQLAFAVAPLVVIPQIITSKMADCCWQDQRVLEGYGKGRQVEPQEFPEVLDVFRDLQLEISASHKEAGNRRGTQTRVPWMQRPTKEQTLAPQLPWSEPFLQTRPNNRLQSGSSSLDLYVSLSEHGVACWKPVYQLLPQYLHRGNFVCADVLFAREKLCSGIVHGRIDVRWDACSVHNFLGRAEVGVWLPCAIYGTCCILAVLMLRLLPETKGRELAQTVADIEAWCVAKSPSVQKCKSSEADQEMVAV